MKEIRNLLDNITYNNDRTIEGYAIVYNSYSKDLGGFIEIIDPTALDGVLDNSDVLCLLDHNIDRGVLARYTNGKGSLLLESDEKGLKYMFEAPNTALGDEVLEAVKRGDINSSSFAFDVDVDEWDKNEDGIYIRTIKKIKNLYDVSPVYFAAYDATSVNKRGMEELLKKENELIIKKKKIEDYYKEIESIYLKK